MSGFAQSSLAVETWDGHNIVLSESLVYHSEAGETIEVAEGSSSDGASTPSQIWNILPPFGIYWPATVLHDFLYRCTQKPRAECDSLLLEAMNSLGVSPLTAKTIYYGVRLGGGRAFNADRAAQTVMHLTRVKLS